MAAGVLSPTKGISSGNVKNIPLQWDPVWFRQFISHFLQNADIRNANAVGNITITGNLTSPATLTVPASASGYFTLSGTDQVVGSNAGAGQTGARVIFGGLNAGQHTNTTDAIVLGDAAFSAGTSGTPITSALLNGLVAIGSSAAPKLTAGTNAAPTDSALIVIGMDAFKIGQFGDSSVVIGQNALGNYDANSAAGGGLTESVVIGNSAAKTYVGNGSQFAGMVVVGYQALGTNSANQPMSNSVIIGFQAAAGGSQGHSGNVIIGPTAGPVPSSGTVSNTVSIGSNCVSSLGAAGGCVFKQAA